MVETTAESVAFVRRFAALLQAGSDPEGALELLAGDSREPSLARASRSVLDALRTGSSLAGALASRPEIGTPLLVAAASVGERTGLAPELFHRLGALLERWWTRRSKALAVVRRYGAGTALTIGMLALFLVGVIPEFRAVYRAMNIELPVITKLALAASSSPLGNPHGCELALLLSAWAAIRCRRSARFRLVVLSLAERTPAVGAMIRRARTAWLFDGLATLLGSGVSALESLRMLEASAGPTSFGRGLAAAQRFIGFGETLSGGLRRARVIDEGASVALQAGEEYGDSAAVCAVLANVHGKRVDGWVRTAAALSLPAIIVGVGIVLGFLVMVAFMPMLHL